MAEATIFTKIINGDIPAHKIYEDDRIFACMDIFPIQPGTIVVFTKNPVDNIEDLPDEDYQALWATVKKLAHQLRVVFPTKKKIGMKVEGLDVPHAHVVMFPIDSGDEFRARQDTSKEPDHSALAALAQALRIG